MNTSACSCLLILQLIAKKAPEPKLQRFLKATADYEAKDDKELSFKKGELIAFGGRDESGFLEGTLNGKTGFFPASVVEECTHEGVVSLHQLIGHFFSGSMF